MYLGERVAVVVPAYNEGGHIRAVVETLPDIVDRAYVVDDASTDDTWSEIRAAVRAAPAGRTLTPSAGPGAADGADAITDDGADETIDADATTDDGTGANTDVVASLTDGGQATDGGQSTDGGQATNGGQATGGGQATDSTGLPGELPVRDPNDGDDPVIVAVRHSSNRGRGGAVKKGYRLALADGMDVVAVMDGDGQMDPDQFERVVHPVATGVADYAKGNRLDGPEYWRGMSGWRLFGNVLLTGLTRVSSGYWGLRDPQNGYTAISRETLESLPLDDLYEDYGFLNDLLSELSIVGARVTDVSLPAVYGDEESGIRYGQFVPAVSMLLFANFLRRLYVDGVHRGHLWLPTAYGLAGLGWLSVVMAVLAPVVPGGGPSPIALATVSGLAPALGSPFGLLGVTVVATVLAVVLDRRHNAVLDAAEVREVSTG